MRHNRLGHQDLNAIEQLEKENMLEDFWVKQCDKQKICESCIKEKITQKPFSKKSQQKCTEIFYLIYAHACRSMQTVMPGGMQYIMMMMDDNNSYTHMYLLSKKS